MDIKVTVSSYLFDDEPKFYSPLDNSQVCEISDLLDGNQIRIETNEGAFLVTLVRNGPSTIQRLIESDLSYAT